MVTDHSLLHISQAVGFLALLYEIIQQVIQIQTKKTELGQYAHSLPFQKSKAMYTDQYVAISIHFEYISIQFIKPKSSEKTKQQLIRIAYLGLQLSLQNSSFLKQTEKKYKNLPARKSGIIFKFLDVCGIANRNQSVLQHGEAHGLVLGRLIHCQQQHSY